MRNLIAIVVVVVVAAMAWGILTMPDRRTPGQHVSDAIDQLPNGLDKAGRELEPRTPGQRIGDTVKDAGQNIKDNTGN